MSDRSSSSTSKSPSVAKILIDLSEYKNLLQLRKYFDEHEKHVCNQLHSSVQHQQKGEGQPAAVKPQEVDGNDASNENNEISSSEEKVANYVLNRLQSMFGLVIPQKPQIGAGTDS